MGNIEVMADYIQKQLIEKGFTIQRLDAITTKSIYLKLDYGLCNSIRISDHAGKKEYSYRFNILRQMPIKTYQYFTNGEYPRGFYSFDMVDRMIDDIIERKQERITRYGKLFYNSLQEKEKTENDGKKGFWSKAKLIN